MAESRLSKVKRSCEKFMAAKLTSRISNFYESQYRKVAFVLPSRSLHSSSPNLTRLGRLRSKFNRRFFVVNGALIFIGTVCYEFYLFRKYFRSTLPENVSASDNLSGSMYVYQSDPMFLNLLSWKKFLYGLQLNPFITSYRKPIWHFIHEINCSDSETRGAAIQALANIKELTDLECHSVSSSINFKAAIAIANFAADPRLIPAPCGVSRNEHISLPAKMREILSELPRSNIHEEVLKEALMAIAAFDPTYEEYYESQLDFATSFELDLHVFTNPTKRLSEVKFLVPCLNAILSHTRLREQIPDINRLGILNMLNVIADKHRTNTNIMCIVIKIISNVTWHPDAASFIENAGLLRLIAELSLDPDIKLCLPARKALHNLDREGTNDPLLPPGVFQLFPSFRFDDKSLDIDIVFIHGIMGGVFRTWRRQDKEYHAEEERGFQASADVRERARILKTGASKKDAFTVDLDIEAEIEEESKSAWAERIRTLRSKVPITYGPKLSPGKESEYKPANRELRDGVLYFLPDDEKIELESPTVVPTENTKCWPRDWLPKDIPGARVIAVDFESFITNWNPVRPIESLSRSLVDRSAEILEKLSSADVGKRPIIWVTHSAGGLLVKQLLLQASTSLNPKMKCLSENTEAILFYSTPHFGTVYAAKSPAGRLFLLPTVELKELNPGSEHLNELNDRFKDLLEKYSYRVVSFGEMGQTLSTVGIKYKLVSLQSSDPGFGEYYALDLNHLDICKPVSRGSFIYRKLIDITNAVRSNSQKFINNIKPDV